MKPLDRIGGGERAVIDDRNATGYAAPLRRFADHEPLLHVLLDRLLPGVARVDLAAFVDTHTGQPMGRGDRRVGLPAEPDLFNVGLDALAAASFTEMTEHDQRALIGRMRRGDADIELDMPAKDFVDRLLDKALAGYLAHPDTWIRIGFSGPAYPDGYARIGPAEIAARHDREPGWKRL